MPMETASAESAAEISSSTIKYVTVSRPMPSYSSGVHIPRKPSFPSSSITSRGKWLVRSHSAAKGSIFSSANSRASSTTWARTSVAVCIEPLARFAAELPRCHHPFQERRRPVFLFVEPILKHFHDGQTHIQTDQVRERERTERMTHPQLHHLVDRLGRRDSILHTENGLVDHRHEYAVGYEAWRVVDLDRSLTQLLSDCDGFRDGVVRRRFATNYFDERHHRNRVHEVHPHNGIRPPCLRGNLADGDRRRIGGENRAGRRQLIEIVKDVEFDLGVLGRGFEHKFNVVEGIEVGGGFDAAERVCRQLIADSAFFLQARQ